jgi:thiamine monophosphate kinase
MRVTFALVKEQGNNKIIYPDDISKFGNTVIAGDVVIADYYGELPLDAYITPAEYRTRVRPGEVIVLMGNQGYAKIYRAAYPQGNKPEDDDALCFIERARFPTSTDGLIDVADATMTSALDYFITANYITQADKIRIQLGVAI